MYVVCMNNQNKYHVQITRLWLCIPLGKPQKNFFLSSKKEIPKKNMATKLEGNNNNNNNFLH